MFTIISNSPPSLKKRAIAKKNFILAMQLDLLQKALAAWPRRNAPLLAVNCGSGEYLPLIWQSGFDVVGTEHDRDRREVAQALPIPGLEVHAATDDDLPFDDDYFDWVILHIRHAENGCLHNCLGQALRVARRGFMLTFWNSSSLPGLALRLRNKKRPWLQNAPSWGQVWRLAHALSSGKLTGMATLCAPECAWRDEPLAREFNSLFSWTPFGAWCIVRVDLAPLRPVTPLPLRLGRRLEQPTPAMDYAHKTCNHPGGKLGNQ